MTKLENKGDFIVQVTWAQLSNKFSFRLSLVAEEIGNDFEKILAFATDLDIKDVEFGTLWGKRIDLVSQKKLIKAKELLEEFDMRARVIAPQTFKSVLLGNVPLEHIEDEPHFQEHMQLLKVQLSVAKFFDAPLTRVFSFRREGMIGLGNPSPIYPRGGEFPEQMQEKVARAFSLACQEAEKVRVPLALENVRSCWGNSGYNTSLILERVNSPWLTVIWDPANAFVSGEVDAYPVGYEAVKPYISHVHLKDAVVIDDKSGLTLWERIGDGSVDYKNQMNALNQSEFSGCVSIETHWSPPDGEPESNTRATYAGLMDILDDLVK